MAAAFIPALPGHFIDHQGGQRPPISYPARVAVRVADAAIARALWRAHQRAVIARASYVQYMRGLPAWPHSAPPHVNPRRDV